MNKYQFTSTIRQNPFQLRGFLGVDFTNENSEVDQRRSPDSLNMVSNLGGNIVKRNGIKQLHQVSVPIPPDTKNVNSIFKQQISIDGTERDVFIAHVSQSIKYYDGSAWQFVKMLGTTTNLLITDTKTKFVYNQKRLMLIGDSTFIFLELSYTTALVVESFTMVAGDDIAYGNAKNYFYVPTTSISRTPSGTGVAYEQANLLFDRRTNLFLADGTSTNYVLDSEIYPNVATDTISAWSGTTKYAIDELVSYSGGYYKSLVADNENNIPNASGTNSIAFNGTSTYIDCGYNFHNWTDSGVGTMTFQFKFAFTAKSPVGVHTLFSYGTSSNNLFIIAIDGTTRKITVSGRYNSGALTVFSHGSPLTAGATYTVIVEITDKATIKVRNSSGGVEGSDYTSTWFSRFANSSSKKYIGKDYSGANFFQGTLYDVYFNAGQSDYTGKVIHNANGLSACTNLGTSVIDTYTTDGSQNLTLYNSTITISATTWWQAFQVVYDVKVEIKDTKDEYQETTAYTLSGLNTIVFSVAPTEPVKMGYDNVRITYRANSPTNAGYNLSLGSAKAFTLFGLNNSFDYIFLCGYTDSNKYKEYYGKFDNKLYIGEYMFTEFGTKPIGYSHIGSEIALHTEKMEGFPTIYMRGASIDSEGEVIFPLKTGVSGVGALNSDTFTNLTDTPVWLSEYGVVGLASTNVANYTHTQDRGYYVNTHILANGVPSEAVGFVYDNKYFLSVPQYDGATFTGNNTYVADTRKKSSANNATTPSYQYDWYFWNNLNIYSYCVDQNILYFGDRNGCIYRMKTDADTDPYKDDVYGVALAQPVVAHWTTPVMNMGDITVKKTLKNLWVRLKKYPNMGFKIYYSTVGIVKEAYDGYFDFTALDFTRLNLSTDTDPLVAVANRAERKFMSIQFKVESDDEYQFGLLEIVGKYTVNNQYKG